MSDYAHVHCPRCESEVDIIWRTEYKGVRPYGKRVSYAELVNQECGCEDYTQQEWDEMMDQASTRAEALQPEYDNDEPRSRY